MIEQSSFRAENHLKIFGKDRLKFGVELEVEAGKPKGPVDYSVYESHRCSRAEQVERVLNTPEPFVIIKEDGSLDNGFEIVTAPAALNEHRKRWQAFFQEVSTLGITTKRSCGMHVHFTRAALTPSHIGRIVQFVTEPQNRKMVVKVAGRQRPEYASLAKKVKEIVEHDCSANAYACIYGSRPPNHHWLKRDRYDAVNITNPNTVEFRIFASTLNRERFFTNLEFVAATIKFTTKRADLNLTAPKFCEWLRKPHNTGCFPHLAKFLSTYASPAGELHLAA
jgi:hypothetical protein